MIISLILSILFFIGLYLPTIPTDGNWMQLEIIYLAIAIIVIVVLLFKQKKIDIKQITLGVIFNGLALYFTKISNPNSNPKEMLLYYLIFFIALTLVLQLDFTNVNSESVMKYLKIFLLCISILSIIISVSIIAQIGPITGRLITYYSSFYPELVPRMISLGKPVNTFGVHSLAGVFNFLFFLLNFATFYVLKAKEHFIISLFFLFFLVRLQSTTSLVCLLIAIMIIGIYIYTENKYIFFGLLALVITFLVLSWNELSIVQILKRNLFNEDSTNGLMVRFGPKGVLYGSLQQIIQYPFKGTGYVSVPDTYYIDSGIIHFALRTSVIGMLAFYGMLLNFFVKNLNWLMGVALFTLFMFFEIGFSNFLYFRIIYFLPFFIFYLKQLILIKKNQKEMKLR